MRADHIGHREEKLFKEIKPGNIFIYKKKKYILDDSRALVNIHSGEIITDYDYAAIGLTSSSKVKRVDWIELYA